MRICGNDVYAEFNQHVKEPGILYGANDVLKGKTVKTHVFQADMFGSREYDKVFDRKLYLHIPTSLWSTCTGMLREYLLPWRWKVAYLDREDASAPTRVLVQASIGNDSLPAPLSTLSTMEMYEEILGHEYIRDISKTAKETQQKFTNILGDLTVDMGKPLYRIFRDRGVFSSLKYAYLKHFSDAWKEVRLQTQHVSEVLLIKRIDEAVFNRLRLIRNA